MFLRYRSTRLSRRGLTLMELMVASAILMMVVAALGGLARTAQQSFEYAEGYGTATQHARVALDRIARNVAEATANERFPGCLVVSETVGTYEYPDTLVVWHPSAAAVDPAGLPRYKELIVYCPDPNTPGRLVELTAPGDTRTVPAADNAAAWRAAITSMKSDSATKSVVLTDLLRTCLAVDATESSRRGCVRFDVRLRPSAADWAAYKAGKTAWSDLPWVQGIYGTQFGMRQTWVRVEMQLLPGAEWVATKAAAGQAVPFFGSAALYYPLQHP